MRPVTTLPVDGVRPTLEETLEREALRRRTVRELEAELTTWAGRVAAGEARLLALLGEFDERSGWAGTGILSCAHWVMWRLGMGQAAAHERVRVARSLRVRPIVAGAFAAGRLSYSQVRAITRVVGEDDADQRRWVGLARSATGRSARAAGPRDAPGHPRPGRRRPGQRGAGGVAPSGRRRLCPHHHPVQRRGRGAPARRRRVPPAATSTTRAAILPRKNRRRSAVPRWGPASWRCSAASCACAAGPSPARRAATGRS